MTNIFTNMPNVSYPIKQKPKNALDVNTAINNPQMDVSNVLPASKVQNDSVEIGTKTEKKGPIKAIKGFIANVKKFFNTSGEYIKGGAKGIAGGAIAGSVVYTAGSIINHFKTKGIEKAARAAQAAGEEFTKKAHKIPNKTLAFVVGGLVLASNLWTASLNATEKNSGVDHRWIGHKQ